VLSSAAVKGKVVFYKWEEFKNLEMEQHYFLQIYRNIESRDFLEKIAHCAII
jgi:hypothetical protein